jgi:MIP family channel proteins
MKSWVSGDDLTKALAELIATFTFIFISIGTVGAAILSGGAAGTTFLIIVGLGFGIGIFVGVMTVGRISGAHMNPAVTLAALVTGNISVVRAMLYVVAQLGGAVLAIAVLDGALFNRDGLGVQSVVNITATQGMVLEIFLTFFLVFTVFAVAMDKRANTPLAGVAIALAVTAGHFIGVGFTGTGMNPARSFGPAAFYGEFTHHWVYWVGPLVGGTLAALVYVYFFGDDAARKKVGKFKLSGEISEAVDSKPQRVKS